jgi:flagellar hook-basal body complex protein FliE
VNVQLKPFDFAAAAQRAGMAQVAERVRAATQPREAAGAEAAGAVNAGSFSAVFSQALTSVSQAQNTSTALQRQVSMDNPTVSIEETMIAMQKAQIGFSAAVQVRNRLVQAYSEIMNMQV